jgi:hypothetical protein
MEANIQSGINALQNRFLNVAFYNFSLILPYYLKPAQFVIYLNNSKMRNWILTVLLFIGIFTQLNAQSLERLDVDFLVDGNQLDLSLVGGLNAPQLSAVDLNNDGIDDLFIFDRVGNVALTFLNNGEAENAYSFAPEFIDNFPSISEWVLLRDYNHDGAMDIFAYSDIPGFHGVIAYKGYYNQDNEIEFERIIFDEDTNLIKVPLISNPSLQTQVYITNIDYPAVDDLDCDGDLDILTFNINGGYVEFYQNQSVELGYGTDTLIYRLEDDCWGGFYESGITIAVDLAESQGECFNNFTDDPIDMRHAGSTLLTYDADNDGDKELVLGDLNFENLNFLHNEGECDDAWMNTQDNAYPSNTNSTEIPIFPAAFYLDVNNDGNKDLLTAPNVKRNGEDKDVLWFYENINDNEFPEFSYVENNFLVGEMVDVGTGADPCFVDYNADGLLDLVIGNNSLYAEFGAKDPRLFLYENVGTATDPVFELIDDDYLDLNQFSQTIFDFSPEFGDLDSDGDIDVIVGDQEGRIHFAENIAGPGQPLNFQGWTLLYKNIDVGISSNPEMVDINRDGLMDLIIGERNGNINYFRNIGTIGEPDFVGDPTEWPNFERVGYIDTRVPGSATGTGESAPVILDFEDGYRLFTGSEDGRLEVYYNIADQLYDTIPADITSLASIKEGINTNLDIADINNDGYLDIVVGNWRGGISIFGTDLSLDLVSVNDGPENLGVQIFPNPAKDQISIQVLNTSNTQKQLALYDAVGRIVMERNWSGHNLDLNVEQLPSGIYFAKVRIGERFQIEKIIVE